MSSFVDDVTFWDELYLSDSAGWDLKSPNPVFIDLITESKLLNPCKLLVTGSGKGYDAIEAAQKGFTVTAVDFSPYAVKFAKDAAQSYGLSIDFLQEDIFLLSEIYCNTFDAVFEYTTLCAVSPSRRDEFIKKITSTLKQGGGLFVLLFPVDGREGGPPFNIDMIEFYNLTTKYLKLEYFFRNINSVKPRNGKEVLFIFKKTEK